jgi:transposase
LAEKLTYIRNHWDGLQTFLTAGRVEIASNMGENLIRPIALNRKNAPFAGHEEGGIAWGRIASLIETCKINGIEPFAYVKATLTALANSRSESRLDDLMPWNFMPSRKATCGPQRSLQNI